MTLHPDRLDVIVRTHRGKTYLVKALKATDQSLTHWAATAQIETVWKDKSLTPEEQYKIFAEMLDVSSVTLTKEQFLKMIEDAIDNGEKFYMTQLEAVHLLCDNLTKLGGLEAVAKRLSNFVDKI